MLWGYFSAAEMRRLVRIAAKYTEALEENLLKSGHDLSALQQPEAYIQVNDPLALGQCSECP